MRPTPALVTALLIAGLTASTAAAGTRAAAPPQNPATAANGYAMMHGDTASSDTTPVAGPDPRTAVATPVVLGAVCPSVLVGSDGYPLATCTQVSTRQPTVYLLDPATGLPLTSIALAAGSSVLGGVYTYLDPDNQVVLVDGNNDLLRIRHVHAQGQWHLLVSRTTPLGEAFVPFCGTPSCDTVVGLTPDFAGRIWFATVHGLVGTVLPGTGSIRTLRLPPGEQIGNSISAEPGYVAAVTDHALYLLAADPHGSPRVVARRPYDRGGPRKPGQLSDGSGTTPVFFGPHHGRDYLAIVDNARPHEHLLVLALPTPHRPHGLDTVCDLPVLTRSPHSGTEDAPIGYDRTVIVTSTYGYPYPAGTTGSSTPAAAPFLGGMTRVDIRPDGQGCQVVWDNLLRSAALPRLSLADDRIDTVLSTPALAGETQVYGDAYSYARIDVATGQITGSAYLGSGPSFDTLQLVGVTTRAGVLYQGTLSGYVRIAPLTVANVPAAG